MLDDDLTSAFVTFGMISGANKTALETWFGTLMAEVMAGRGKELLSSSIVGRSFAFSNPTLTVQVATQQLSRAINILNGRSRSKVIMRF